MPRTKATRTSKARKAPREKEQMLSPEGIHESIFAIKVLDLANSMDRAAGLYYGARFGLRVADLRVLVHAARLPGLSLVEISRRARIDRAWISRSVQRLEKRGLVKKHRVDGDDRAQSVFLTDKGEALLRQLIPVVLRRQRRLLQGENQKELEQTLERLRRRVEEMMIEDDAEWARRGE